MSFENKHCAITTRPVYVACNISELTGYNLIGTWRQFDANLNKKKLAFVSLVRRQNFAILSRGFTTWLFFPRTSDMNFFKYCPFRVKGYRTWGWVKILMTNIEGACAARLKRLRRQSYGARRKESVLSRRLVMKCELLASPWALLTTMVLIDFLGGRRRPNHFYFVLGINPEQFLEIDKTHFATNLHILDHYFRSREKNDYRIRQVFC